MANMRLFRLPAAALAAFVAIAAIAVLAVSAGAANGTGARTFVNANVVRVPAGGNSGDAFGKARPYPSTIQVAGFKKVTDVDVTLRSVRHEIPDDMDVLLVGPTGRNAIVMSDAGGGNEISDTTLTFDDEARRFLPDGSPIAPGRYKTSNYDVGNIDFWPAPAPSQTGNRLLSRFDGTNPDGVWKLYVYDNNFSGAGSFAKGWSIRIQGVCKVQNSNDKCIARRQG